MDKNDLPFPSKDVTHVTTFRMGGKGNKIFWSQNGVVFNEQKRKFLEYESIEGFDGKMQRRIYKYKGDEHYSAFEKTGDRFYPKNWRLFPIALVYRPLSIQGALPDKLNNAEVSLLKEDPRTSKLSWDLWMGMVFFDYVLVESLAIKVVEGKRIPQGRPYLDLMIEYESDSIYPKSWTVLEYFDNGTLCNSHKADNVQVKTDVELDDKLFEPEYPDETMVRELDTSGKSRTIKKKMARLD